MNNQMRVYVGTYSKYNNGSLAGAWLALDDYADKADFIDACHALHSNEADPELMNQDWECIPAGLVSECSVSASLWEIMQEANQEAVAAYLECFGEWDAEDYQERYRGHYAGWVAMAEEIMEESGELDTIPAHLRNYFDFEAYARDLRCGGDMCEHAGHFFSNN